MSVNHYSRDNIQHNTRWWQHNQNAAAPPQPENAVTWFHRQNDAVTDHRESMFEKSLTPSDVGKLNRLVIPKQQAEKYFPLNASSAASSSTAAGAGEADKGLLLSFEDESGKCWRFRYSYWNSSQSYVLTKGWSRYVKEKQLDAGDVVFFQRLRADARRLFIGWRRRGEASNSADSAAVASTGGHGTFVNTASYPNGMVAFRQLYQVHGSLYGSNPPYHSEYSNLGAATAAVEAQTPAAAAVGSPRTLRLFGVNVECQPQPDDHAAQPSTPSGSSRSSAHPHQHFYSYPLHVPVPPHHDLSISFSGDTMRQTGDRRG